VYVVSQGSLWCRLAPSPGREYSPAHELRGAHRVSAGLALPVQPGEEIRVGIIALDFHDPPAARAPRLCSGFHFDPRKHVDR
jgi:hypothetical protein